MIVPSSIVGDKAGSSTVLNGGRVALENILKVLHFQVTSKPGYCTSDLCATFADTPFLQLINNNFHVKLVFYSFKRKIQKYGLIKRSQVVWKISDLVTCWNCMVDSRLDSLDLVAFSTEILATLALLTNEDRNILTVGYITPWKFLVKEVKIAEKSVADWKVQTTENQLRVNWGLAISIFGTY